jgi:hypothetical protein
MISDGLGSESEHAVLNLRRQVAKMRGAGRSPEDVARNVHLERRQLAAHFKERTPEPLRSMIYHRTFGVYGDAMGPTIERLRAEDKSWDDIIDSATRPGLLPVLGSTHTSITGSIMTSSAGTSLLPEFRPSA